MELGELSTAQRKHLANLERMRRELSAIRAGRSPAPAPFAPDVEAKIAALRDAGHLDDAQERFLRLCGPAEVERQSQTARELGPVYGGLQVPSRRSLKRERLVQRFAAAMNAKLRADSTARPPAVTRRAHLRPLRSRTRLARPRARSFRRVARGPALQARPGRSDDPDPEPPARPPLHAPEGR